MKKMVFVMTLASASLFAFCDPFNGGNCTNESELFISNQSIVNNIVVDTPKTGLITSTNNFAASAQFIYSDDFKMFNVPVGANIGSHFGVEANMPVVSIKDSTTGETNTGVGDISVGGNFHFGAFSEKSGLNITTLLYKTTTGDSKKGLGSDKPAYIVSHKIDKNVYKEIDVNALASYTFNDKSVSGNSYLVALGGSMPCLMYNKIRTNVKVTYFHIDKGNDSLLLPETKAADLWLSWDFNKLTGEVPVSAGLKIPLQNEVGSVQADKKFLFYVSATGLF